MAGTVELANLSSRKNSYLVCCLILWITVHNSALRVLSVICASAHWSGSETNRRESNALNHILPVE